LKNFYIDVYFLINFTVDFLSLHFASRISRLTTSTKRLCVIALLGSISSITCLFLPAGIFPEVFITGLFLFSVGLFGINRCSIYRRIRFVVTFFGLELLIGGIVYFAYSALDNYVAPYIEDIRGGSENKKALIFSLFILLAIGVIKLMILIFPSGVEGMAHLKIKIGADVIEADALVDTGNLVTDPMNMCPVLFVKPSLAGKILPQNVLSLSEIDSLDNAYRKRIRLIPVSRGGETHVMTGIRPDEVIVRTADGERNVMVTLVIDKEGGTYGGYELLAPSAII